DGTCGKRRHGFAGRKARGLSADAVRNAERPLLCRWPMARLFLKRVGHGTGVCEDVSGQGQQVANLERRRYVSDLFPERARVVLPQPGQPDHGGRVYSQRDSFLADKPRMWSEKRLANAVVLGNYDLASDGKRVVALMPDETTE